MATLREALFPRLTAAQATGAPWYSPKVGLASILDQASLPGRAYVSLGRPEGETYSDAVARTEPRMDLAGYQGEGDEFAETVLRDPSLPLGAIGGAIRGLGRVGRAVVDAGIGGATGAADQYSQGRDMSLGTLLAGAGMSIVPSVAMGGRKNPVSRMAEEITPEQRAANFKNWFGDSKVVDEAGNPLVVYHGTKAGGIEEFRPKGGREGWEDVLSHFKNAQKYNERYGAANFRSGSFFSPKPDYAGAYSYDNTGSIYPTYIKAENPLYLDQKTGEISGIDASKTPDALIVINDGDVNEIAVIDPIQIKSATGNRGTFDPSDPNITHFTGTTVNGPSVSVSASNRVKRAASEAGLRKYLSGDGRMQVGGPVRTTLGGLLMSSPGDTYYTRRAR